MKYLALIYLASFAVFLQLLYESMKYEDDQERRKRAVIRHHTKDKTHDRR